MTFWHYLVLIVAGLVVFDLVLVAWLHVGSRDVDPGDRQAT
jgi:hypothetical protein